MIAIEDQIRRYATDVAGPALGAPPADLDVVGHPRHRGRWVLVAALVVFIAGLTWLATRPTELGDRPSVDTVPLPPLASWAGSWGTCVDRPPPEDGIVTGPERIDGIHLEGALGDGICIGVGRGEPAIAWVEPPLDQGLVWLTVDGVPRRPIAVNSCTFRSTSKSGFGGTGVDVGGRPAMLYAVAPDVRTVVLSGSGGPVSAESFDVPGVEGFRVVAMRGPTFPQALVPTGYFDAEGSPLPDEAQPWLPPVPEGCPPDPTIPPQAGDGAS
jgi:hypothetical protein